MLPKWPRIGKDNSRKKGRLSELEELHFGGAREVPAAGGLDEDHVLDPDGAPHRI